MKEEHLRNFSMMIEERGTHTLAWFTTRVLTAVAIFILVPL
jgi:hypothetical protein